jgi:uncharacterized repeat protein (TIGR03943 family)
VRHDLHGLLLLLVGGVLVKIVADGTYLRYVRPGFAPILLVTGLVILVLALSALLREWRRTPHDERDGRDAEADVVHDGHGAHSSSWAAWLLLVPALTIMLIAPPALGSDAVGAGAPRTAPAVGAADHEPLPPGEAPALDVVDLVSRVAADPDGPVTRTDVTLVGFLVPARPPAQGTDLARLVIACCAADASPVRVHLAGAGLPALETGTGSDQWVRVRGRVVHGTGTRSDGFVPTLRIVDAELVAPPDPVYEY